MSPLQLWKMSTAGAGLLCGTALLAVLLFTAG